MSNVRAGLPRSQYRKLRPRPHGPAREKVISHQRARLHGAMLQAVAERGYEAVTVRELSMRAGVSTRTLYELFATGKQGCLLSAYDAAVRRMARRIALAYASERDREQRLACAFEAFVREISREPQAARLVLVDVFAAGPAALTHVEHTSSLFEGMVGLSFRHAACAASPPPLAVKGIVAGVARVARVRLLDGRAAELQTLTGELVEWALSYRSCATATLACPGHASERLPRLPLGGGERGNDRTRILCTAARLAARDGYATLTAGRIAATVGISCAAFDEQLKDVEQCLLEAIELLTGRALASTAVAGLAGKTWPGGVYRALVGLTRHIASDPVFARLAFVEIMALGPAGLRLRERLLGDFAELLWRWAPSMQRPSELAAEAIVGAVWGIIHCHVAHRATHRLPSTAAQLAFIALAPAIGAQRAIEAIAVEQQADARRGVGAFAIPRRGGPARP